MMLQLSPPIPLKTPKGDAWATALIDYGPQWDLMWVTFVEATGECWTFRNPEVRQGKNYTFNHPHPTPIRPRDNNVKVPEMDAPKIELKNELPERNLDFSAFPNFDPSVDKKNGHANGKSNGYSNGNAI